MNNWKDLLKDSYKFSNEMIQFHEIDWGEVFSKNMIKVYEMPDLSIWNDGWEIIIENNNGKEI